MRIPRVKKRRLYDRRERDGYLESDNDFIKNNMRAVIWFLENRDKIAAALFEREFKRYLAEQTMLQTNGQDG